MAAPLDISPFRAAADELEEMYTYACSPLVKSDARLFDYMRTAVIKGFEYTYEMAHKSLRRFIDDYGPEQENDDEQGFRGLLRLGNEYGVVDDIAAWIQLREKRNITSHAYNRSKADQIFALVPDLLRHSRFMLEGIDRRLKADQ